jgi:hypothetical protein
LVHQATSSVSVSAMAPGFGGANRQKSSIELRVSRRASEDWLRAVPSTAYRAELDEETGDRALGTDLSRIGNTHGARAGDARRERPRLSCHQRRAEGRDG